MNVRRLRYRALAGVVTATWMVSVWTVAQGQNDVASKAARMPETLPQWAYIISAPAPPGAAGFPRPQDDGTLRHVPGSTAAFTLTQIDDGFANADWHPDNHPPMPESVAQGRKPVMRACATCHLPNGQGQVENSSLAGLPAAYFVQQVADFKNGLRKSSEPRNRPENNMIVEVAKNATDAEVATAAAYFSGLKLKPWIRVIESRTVPKTRTSGVRLVALESGGTEPIAGRIIELPENQERTRLHDSESGWVAYVPVGSIMKGKVLVTTDGAGKTTQCAICHGQDLRGLGNVPSIAGRSPTYIIRQLFDIQSGARNGPGAQLMKEVVAKLTVSDMVSIAAYTASRTP